MSRISKILLRVSLLSLALFYVQQTVYGNGEASKRASRFEEPVGSARLTETLTGLLNILNEPNAMLIVRVCSRKPLPETLAIATASPLGIYDYLVKAEGYSPERILLARSEDCLSGDLGNAATELWVVYQGGERPPYVESFKPCQVNIQSLLSKQLGESAGDYKKALRRLVSVLHQRPQAFGVINGFHYTGRRKPLLTVRKSLREARKVLRQSGIMPNRYLVRLKPWNEVWSPRYPEPRYPAVLVFEVSKSCNQ